MLFRFDEEQNCGSAFLIKLKNEKFIVEKAGLSYNESF
jgi:hypothetical protein